MKGKPAWHSTSSIGDSAEARNCITMESGRNNFGGHRSHTEISELKGHDVVLYSTQRQQMTVFGRHGATNTLRSAAERYSNRLPRNPRLSAPKFLLLCM